MERQDVILFKDKEEDLIDNLYHITSTNNDSFYLKVINSYDTFIILVLLNKNTQEITYCRKNYHLLKIKDISNSVSLYDWFRTQILRESDKAIYITKSDSKLNLYLQDYDATTDRLLQTIDFEMIKDSTYKNELENDELENIINDLEVKNSDSHYKAYEIINSSNSLQDAIYHKMKLIEEFLNSNFFLFYDQFLNKMKNIEEIEMKIESILTKHQNKLKIQHLKESYIKIIQQKKSEFDCLKKITFDLKIQQGFIYQSNIITDHKRISFATGCLNSIIKFKSFKKIYDSITDGDSVEVFHKAVKGKYPIVIFIEDTEFNVFGGFTTIPFSLNNSTLGFLTNDFYSCNLLTFFKSSSSDRVLTFESKAFDINQCYTGVNLGPCFDYGLLIEVKDKFCSDKINNIEFKYENFNENADKGFETDSLPKEKKIKFQIKCMEIYMNC